MKIKRDILKIGKKEYDKSISNIISELKKNSFVKSVYLFGEIKFPGISDIDMLIVLSENGFDENKKKILDIIYSSSRYSKYLFYHDPLIVKEKEAKYLKFFHTTKGLKLLSGKEISFQNIKNHFIEDLWNSFFYRTYLNESKKKVVSERRILLILNNLAESIRYNLNEKEGSKFKDKVNSIRKAVLEDKIMVSSEKELLEEGIYLLKKHEFYKQKKNNIKLSGIIWDKRRSFFIPSDKLRLIDLKLIKIYKFPKYYFERRGSYKKEVFKFIKENKMTFEEFKVMRKRSQSPSFFGF